jgi:hypothetical protein
VVVDVCEYSTVTSSSVCHTGHNKTQNSSRRKHFVILWNGKGERDKIKRGEKEGRKEKRKEEKEKRKKGEEYVILRTEIEANIELVRRRREAVIQKNNTTENKRRIAHTYKEGDKVLILSGGLLDPKLQLHEGPFKVLSFDKHTGTLRIQRKNYIEPVNIRRVRPFFDKKIHG